MPASPDQPLFDAWATLTAPDAPYEVATVAVRGKNLRAFRHAPPDARAIWLATAAFGDRDYLVYGNERLTYAQAHRIVASVAAWLAGQGLRRGDRVAIAMRNYPEWLLAYWACVASGLVAVGLNAWWAPDELAFALEDCQPKAIFADAERLERLPLLAEPIPRVGVRMPARDGVTAWADIIGQPGSLPDVAIDPDDDACIFYTSGTTGRSKGAQLTHRGCANTLYSMYFQAEAQALALGRETSSAPPVGLITTPLFHVTATNCLAYPVTAAGGKLVLMYKWDAGEALRLIERERVSIITGVPTMAREMLNHPEALIRDIDSLSVLSGGGAPVPPDLVTKIDAFPRPVQPSTGFGMTETCGVVTAVTGPYFVARPDSCGRLLPTFEAMVIDADGRPLPQGETGELCLRGAGIIKGYLNRPDATAATIVDGWLRTGDLGRIDPDGFVFIHDRKKDMVLRGGENVYCAEVEAALFRHPDVVEACVFDVPDERLGEEVGAALVLRDGAALTGEDIRRHLSGLIARFKVPRYIWLRTEPLPRNASGKFLRPVLRASLSTDDAV
ncbi:class I adenylate-forming enzyme family protein [Niveispirillum sp.]|uniref:class I adenylate-forming enzyme family protein n=1 Tax=Niveispirillum sp. TaxID=1917217 RepID=UPI001B6E8187|nr:class I adenylate-forming enzyme family protein [Niveispirillum sp.]MBP7338401.1 acyl--CoA ligase [Niveispirillum sp.]